MNLKWECKNEHLGTGDSELGTKNLQKSNRCNGASCVSPSDPKIRSQSCRTCSAGRPEGGWGMRVGRPWRDQAPMTVTDTWLRTRVRPRVPKTRQTILSTGWTRWVFGSGFSLVQTPEKKHCFWVFFSGSPWKWAKKRWNWRYLVLKICRSFKFSEVSLWKAVWEWQVTKPDLGNTALVSLWNIWNIYFDLDGWDVRNGFFLFKSFEHFRWFEKRQAGTQVHVDDRKNNWQQRPEKPMIPKTPNFEVKSAVGFKEIHLHSSGQITIPKASFFLAILRRFPIQPLFRASWVI